jgi:PKD repeat protein
MESSIGRSLDQPRSRVRMRIAARLLCALALAAGVTAPSPARAIFYNLPPGFTSEVVASGLPAATGIAFAPDGRIFITLQGGVVRVWDGVLLPTPFIDLSAQVGGAHDRGLLGITLHPQFPQVPYVYLLFTYDPPGVIPDDAFGARVSRLIRVEADPAQGFNVALPGSTMGQSTPGGPGHWIMLGNNSTLANIGNPLNGRDKSVASCMVGLSMANPPVEDCLPSDELTHSIGTVAFAPDGSMLVSNGDGSDSSSVDPRAFRSFNLDSLAGKILRIDPDTALGLPDNPYFVPGEPERNRSKVLAYGVRNPFRMSIDPATGDPYFGDVGSSLWEEVNGGKAVNFGWPCYEGGAQSGTEGGLTTSLQQPGFSVNQQTAATCGALYAQGLGAVKPPLFAYLHPQGGGGAVVGVTWYTGTAYPPQYRNKLFFADFNTLRVRYLSFDAQGVATVSPTFANSTAEPVTLLQGPDTNLYGVLYNSAGSEVTRIRYTAGGNTPPTAIATASPTGGAAPLAVAFSGATSYDPDAQGLDYAWDFGDGGVSALESPSHTYVSSGTYTAVLTVTEQTAPFASGTASVVITVGSVPPIATITQPSTNPTTFAIDDVLTYAGTATSGTLSWELRNHHNTHIHYDGLGEGSGGSVTLLDHADGYWFELCLTATDQMLSDTQCVDILPRQTEVTVDSDPPGMHIVYEELGVFLTTPAIIEPTENATRTLHAPAVEQWRTFDRWSDGVTTLSRQFTVGTTPLAFEALYVNQSPSAVGSSSSGSGPDRFSVLFDGSASSDPEGGALAYAWDYGDGQSGGGVTPTHVYAAPGSYSVTLTVSDPVGGEDVETLTVDIPNGAPAASFTAAPSYRTVTFDASDSLDPDGDALAYAWDFGDGNVGSGASVTHTYATVGSYVATLGVSDPYLATGTAQTTLTLVTPPPPPGCGLGPELVAPLAALLALRRRRARARRA